jgi:hypothetical protein
MAYEKLQGYLALEVYPSNTTDIPFPAKIATSAATSTTSNKLVDTSQDFVVSGVASGDIVYNTTDSTAATVVSIESATILVLNTDIMASGEAYVLYNASSTKNYQKANNGCVLYVGTTGDLKVDTISGTTVTFKAMPVGFVPIQVSRIYATSTATDIVALW